LTSFADIETITIYQNFDIFLDDVDTIRYDQYRLDISFGRYIVASLVITSQYRIPNSAETQKLWKWANSAAHGKLWPLQYMLYSQSMRSSFRCNRQLIEVQNNFIMLVYWSHCVYNLFISAGNRGRWLLRETRYLTLPSLVSLCHPWCVLTGLTLIHSSKHSFLVGQETGNFTIFCCNSTVYTHWRPLRPIWY